MSGEFHLDVAAFRRELLQADWMLAEMERHAELGLEAAKALAATHVKSGRYEASLHVTSTKSGGIHRERAEAAVVSDDPAALSIEFGHAAKDGTHIDGQYILTRAKDAMQ